MLNGRSAMFRSAARTRTAGAHGDGDDAVMSEMTEQNHTPCWKLFFFFLCLFD